MSREITIFSQFGKKKAHYKLKVRIIISIYCSRHCKFDGNIYKHTFLQFVYPCPSLIKHNTKIFILSCILLPNTISSPSFVSSHLICHNCLFYFETIIIYYLKQCLDIVLRRKKNRDSGDKESLSLKPNMFLYLSYLSLLSWKLTKHNLRDMWSRGMPLFNA